MWFDWRMIPVACIVMGGFIATLLGLGLTVLEFFGVVRPTPSPASWQVLLGGIIVTAAGFVLGYLCKKYPDVLT